MASLNTTASALVIMLIGACGGTVSVEGSPPGEPGSGGATASNGAGAMGPSNAAGAMGPATGSSTGSAGCACTEDADCGPPPSACTTMACDGCACIEIPVDDGTPCVVGICTAGVCGENEAAEATCAEACGYFEDCNLSVSVCLDQCLAKLVDCPPDELEAVAECSLNWLTLCSVTGWNSCLNFIDCAGF